jgi:peroxiredoxin Q/BCP
MLKKGDQLPEVILKDEEGSDVSLHTFLGEKPIVVYFYPKDNTSVCTAQACAFRDQYEDFKALGAEVIGISKDSVESHRKVVKKRKLPFKLLSDPKGTALKAFGVPTGFLGLVPGRVTFVSDKEGKIQHTFRSDFSAQKHIDQALKVLRKLS